MTNDSRIPITSNTDPGYTWSIAVVVGNGLFVLAWVVAAFWQGPHYSMLAHSISDMYAVGAPGAIFLIVVITLSGIVVLLFTGLALWPALRRARWPAAAGSVLLAMSIFGLGDLLTPFEREACRQADSGCTAADQVRNLGGRMDTVLSIGGLVLLVAAGFCLGGAMGRLPEWRRWAWPTRWVAGGILVLIVATVRADSVGLGGLFERLVAATGAAGIAVLAVGVIRASRTSTPG